MASLEDILTLDYVVNTTPKNIDLKVELKKTDLKGTGIFAKKAIVKGEVIALYRLRVFRDETYKSPTNNMYSFAVYTKSKNESKVWLGDLVPESLQPPKRYKKWYVPFWAYFSNEPSPPQTTNAWIDMNTEENYKEIKRVREGDYLIYKLVATKPIKPGDEVVWNYGDAYGERNYDV